MWATIHHTLYLNHFLPGSVLRLHPGASGTERVGRNKINKWGERPGCLVRTSVSLFPALGANTVRWWRGWFFPGTQQEGNWESVSRQGNLVFSALVTVVPKHVVSLFCFWRNVSICSKGMKTFILIFLFEIWKEFIFIWVILRDPSLLWIVRLGYPFAWALSKLSYWGEINFY